MCPAHVWPDVSSLVRPIESLRDLGSMKAYSKFISFWVLLDVRDPFRFVSHSESYSKRLNIFT